MPLARISPTRCTRQLHQIPGVYQGHLPTEATPSTAGNPASCPGEGGNLPWTQANTPQVEPAFTWMTDIPDRLRRRLHWTQILLCRQG